MNTTVKVLGSVVYAGVVAGLVGIGLHMVKETIIEAKEANEEAKIIRNRKRLTKHEGQIRSAQKEVEFNDMWNDYFTEKTGKIY